MASPPLRVVTTNLRSFAPANVLESHADAARRWGAEHVVIDHPPVGWLDDGGMMAFLLRVHGELQHPFGARVLALDGDVVVRADCPSYFDLVAEGSIAGVENDQGDTHPGPGGMAPHVDPFLEQLRAVEPVMVEQYLARERAAGKSRYVNGGVLVYEPDLHADVFRLALRACLAIDGRFVNPALQQTAINVCASGESVAVMPRMFGRLGAPAWGTDGVGKPHAMRAYAYHLARLFGLRDDAQRRSRLTTLDWRDTTEPLEDPPPAAAVRKA